MYVFEILWAAVTDPLRRSKHRNMKEYSRIRLRLNTYSRVVEDRGSQLVRHHFKDSTDSFAAFRSTISSYMRRG